MYDVYEGREFSVFLWGLDENGKEITRSIGDERTTIKMIPSPENLQYIKVGDRNYRFWWHGSGYGDDDYLTFVSEDGQYEIHCDPTTTKSCEVDFSDYPEGTEWSCIVVTASEDEISFSLPLVASFSESDA